MHSSIWYLQIDVLAPALFDHLLIHFVRNIYSNIPSIIWYFTLDFDLIKSCPFCL